jgi:hypothetical protein
MSAHSPALIRSVMCLAIMAIMMVVASVNDMAWRRPTPFGRSIAAGGPAVISVSGASNTNDTLCNGRC